MRQRREGLNRVDRPKAILLAWIVLGLLLTSSVKGQGPVLAEPVASALLRDGELVVPDRNFAIATPAEGWQWFLRKGQGEIRSQETYICKQIDSGAEFQVISAGVRTRFDDQFITGVKAGMEEALTARGFKIMSLDVTESDNPLPHSYRSQWHAVLPDGQSLYGYSYLTASDTVFTLQHITTEATEPPIFTEFASTFRRVHASADRPNSLQGILGYYILLLTFACLAAGLVNRVFGRLVLNGGTLSAVLIVISVVVLAAIGARRGVAADLPPDKLGEIVGRRIGEALIPLLVAVLVSRVFRRRRTLPSDVSDGCDDEASYGTTESR